jgi:hypothetical protein
VAVETLCHTGRKYERLYESCGSRFISILGNTVEIVSCAVFDMARALGD